MNNALIEKTKELVERIGLKGEFIIHDESGKTSGEAASALGVPPDKILKTLIMFAPKERKFIGTLLLGTDRLNINKLTNLMQVRKLQFASPDQIKELTGFIIGGVPPVAVLSCDDACIDENVLKKDFVVGAGGDEHCGFKVNPNELVKKLKLKVASISI